MKYGVGWQKYRDQQAFNAPAPAAPAKDPNKLYNPVTGQEIILPTFNSVADSNGNLTGSYEARDQYNTDALNKLRGEYMRDAGTNSSWANLMLQQNQQDKLAGLDSINAQASSGVTDMMSQLASQGGADSGSRERALSTFGRNSMLERQRANRDFSKRGADVLTKDEENRMAGLNTLNSLEAQRGQYLSSLDQFNVGNRLKEVQNKRQFEMDRYNKDMETWAADKQANAQKGASCFAPDTMITMKDGSKKRIADIRLGEEVLIGGKVTLCLTTLRKPHDKVYDYHGVFVTSMHAVYENREFIRVKDSKISRLVENAAIPVVYNLSVENHVVIAGGTVFGDYDEVTMEDEEEARKELTNGFRKIVS